VTEHVRRYEVGGLIARGGMAEIIAARSVSEGGLVKRVALKRIRTDRSADPVFIARLFDEARLAMQLSHANIVQVFDFGRAEEDEFFLAMEFVEGVDLQRLRLEQEGARLPPPEALHIVAQMLRGLDYAHRRADDAGQPLGIVHLDVKPANVLLSFEGEVKLTDFGVARSRDARRSALEICGTIPFMSPEQARGERVDPRSDVFSAGVVLFALLTGACPFGDLGDAETLERVRSGVLSLPGLPLLDPLLARALDPSPDRRFPTAGAFADALEELLYAQGWRGGGAALAERVRSDFSPERERLAALFAPAAIGAGLAVERATDPSGGSVLSRIPDLEVVERPTVAIVARRARRRWPAGAAGAAALAMVLAAGGAYRSLRLRAQEPELELLAPDAALVERQASRPTPVEPPGPPAPPRVERDQAAPPPAPTPKPALGTLTINADPWGTVTVNGDTLGTTPLLRTPVRAGPATVVIENPKLGRKVFQVRILPNRDLPLIVDLRSAARSR
jgi:tRNA A-37 threonylcarbamoyl transferase component Bud32